MEEIRQIDKRGIALSRFKRRLFSQYVWLLRAFIVLAILGVLFIFFVLGRAFIKKVGWDFYFDVAKSFIFTPAGQLKQIDGRTNILVLGKAGEGNIAPDLTDTMILASVGHEKDLSIDLISLPRDIWIPSLRAKLNSAYYWGNQKVPGGGIVLAKATVEEITSLPIHYAAVLDFSGFEKIIDLLGGIEVEVERSFEDKRYPIVGKENDECDGDPEYTCRYETIGFDKGLTQMDGNTALKFVRSRQSEDQEEGNDFARTKRQQLVIRAIVARIISRDIITSPQKVREIIKLVKDAIETDLDVRAFAILLRRLTQKKDKIVMHVLPEDLLENPPISGKYDNLYVFVPKSGDWREIQKWIKDSF